MQNKNEKKNTPKTFTFKTWFSKLVARLELWLLYPTFERDLNYIKHRFVKVQHEHDLHFFSEINTTNFMVEKSRIKLEVYIISS